MKFIKTNWRFVLILAMLTSGILIMIFQKHDDPGAVVKFQIEELKKEMKDVILYEFDSLKNAVSSPIPVDFSHSDSLQQIALDLNSKIIYELRKKNEAHIDTISGAELKSIFAEYFRQHPMPAH